jgi:protocatechuate 3,4-dioxygenase beta subunit
MTFAYATLKRYTINMKRCYAILIVVLSTGILFLSGVSAGSGSLSCTPTEPDMLGPFYKPDAPKRSSVGSGYVLKGIVRSSVDCSPIAGEVIEFWLAGPNGKYDDAHRATIIADASGSYRFESNVPTPYTGRPPHIHLRVSAAGFKTLVAQHYPEEGKTEAVFDVVLVPAL